MNEEGCNEVTRCTTEHENEHTLVSAIREKYEAGHVEEDDSFCQIYVPKKGPGAVYVGSEEYQAPSRLAVDNCCITQAGTEEQIQSLCCKVQELDIAKNRVTDWQEVFKIVQCTPLLHFINLSFNPLSNSTFPLQPSQTFEHITVLILNGTGVSWQVVSGVMTCFTRLTELHLSLNNYESVELPADTYCISLTKLFINSCRLSQWSDIAKLGRCFPSIDTLNVIKSSISTLTGGSMKDVFPVLKNLNLSGNPLSGWEEVDRFTLFPSLQNLRITDVPFMEPLSEKERRQHLISRLPNIVRLNGSRITEIEREDAERAFIRHFMSQDVKPSRYHELEAIHGKLDPLANVNLCPKNVIPLTVKFEEKTEMMEVDVRQTIFEFKKFLRNFTGLPPLKFRVFHVENFEGKYKDANELKLSNKKLLSLNLREGDEIHIDRKPGT